MGKKTFESFIRNTVSRDKADPVLDEALQDIYENEIKELILYLQDIKETANTDLLNYNIILFGPAGSGKSSFIRSLFNAYTQEYNEVKDISSELIIKSLNQNEGTTKFSQFTLKKGFVTKLKSQGQEFQMKQIGINIYDTRGQVRLNQNEKVIIENLVQGNLKPGHEIINRQDRYAYLLWEFWKQKEELFPQNLLNNQKGINSQPHCLVFVFDGSLEDVPNSEEEVEFYSQIMEKAKQQGYSQPFVIITKIDLFEKRLTNKLKKQGKNEQQIEREIVKQKFELIDNVSKSLNIKRECIDFVENYHSQTQSRKTSIDYYCLMSLGRMIVECENYTKKKITKKFDFCKIFQLIKNILLVLYYRKPQLKIFIFMMIVLSYCSSNLFLIQIFFFSQLFLKMVKFHYQFNCLKNLYFLSFIFVLFLISF